MRAEDRIGKTFGYLTVIAISHRDAGGRAFVRVRCVCGKEKTVNAWTLRPRKTVSCGCYRLKGHNRTHGLSRSPEWRAWSGAKQRCTNPKNRNFPRYGGRGIQMCTRWIDSFEAFLADMGRKPSPKLTLERKDNDKGYEPSNCVWATYQAQNLNRGAFNAVRR